MRARIFEYLKYYILLSIDRWAIGVADRSQQQMEIDVYIFDNQSNWSFGETENNTHREEGGMNGVGDENTTEFIWKLLIVDVYVIPACKVEVLG